MNRRRARLSVIVGTLALAAAPAARAALGPPVTIDGPSSAIVSLDALALAPDGSGALVYRKTSDGAAHVFASLEHAGAWSAPVQLDATLPAGASASAVAVADGGRVAVVWIAGGMLYGSVHAASSSAFTAPQAIAPAGGTPALGMGVSGTAYVAYASASAGPSNVDVARLDRSSASFAVLPGPLNAAPTALAGAGRPSIAVAADGTAVVAWAQFQADGSTHVFVRRASAAGPSPVLDDATVATLAGVSGGSADSPAVGVAYDASDAWVSFRETFGTASRVLVTPLVGDALRMPVFADSLGAGAAAGSASAPSLAVNGNAAGLLAAELSPGNDLVLATLGTPGKPSGWSPGTVLNTTPDAVAPGPLAALSASGSGVVAYSPAAGVLDAELFAADGTASGPLALSNATLGAVLAPDGRGVAADAGGDLLVAYVAGAPAALSLVVQPIVAAPGAPRATGTQLWIADKRPVLRWQASSDLWAPPVYSVYIDGRRVATTSATSYAVPADLREGRHSWKVVASDSLRQTATSQTRRLLINGAHPAVALHIGGSRSAGAALRFTVTASALSGVGRVSLDYGDGHTAGALRSTHVYASAGSYSVLVTVTDRAGLATVLRRVVTIS